MATVFRKTVTKALPPGATIFTKAGKRFARWLDRRGQRRQAPLTRPAKGPHRGKDRIVITAGIYWARYRNAAGLVVEKSTGCRDEQAARQTLAGWLRQVELVRSGVITAAESAVVDQQSVAITDHVEAYLEGLDAGGCTDGHRANVQRCLLRLVRECSLKRLGDLTRDALDKWLARQQSAGMSARTRNLHRTSAVAFGNWCVQENRLVSNPLTNARRADENADRRRKRRALTEDELRRLLIVARDRPLAEYGRTTIRKDAKSSNGRRTWTKEPLTLKTLPAAVERARAALARNPDFLATQLQLGRERALIYKTLVLTGLRRGELASITVGQVDLKRPFPRIQLEAADEKNRQGASLPLRRDLAAELGEWLGDRLEAATLKYRRPGEPIPARLPADEPLFRVPRDLFKILDRDLCAAGIPKQDERGYSVDVHALRHTFGTMLSAAGTAPRTAQEAMRHSSMDLTMRIYTDPKLLDIAGAVDKLPALSLGPEAAVATGTDGAAQEFAPELVLNGVSDGKSVALDDTKRDAGRHDIGGAIGCAVNASGHHAKGCDDGRQERAKGLEPSTYSLGSCNERVSTPSDKGLAPPPSTVCTPVGCEDAELASINAAWPSLSADTKRCLLAIVRASDP